MNREQIAAILRAQLWRDEAYDPKGNGLWEIPTMLTREERKMLSYVAEHMFQGRGAIVDLGCFLGGSSAFLAHGLSRNPSGRNFQVQSFDLFDLGPFERNTLLPPAQLANTG